MLQLRSRHCFEWEKRTFQGNDVRQIRAGRYTGGAPMAMTYIVTERCINSKYMDCVAVCPVDCFYEGENMLVINPVECIGCGACVPVCTAHAIVKVRKGEPASDDTTNDWFKTNAEYARKWPKITQKGAPLPDRDKYRDEPGKRKYFSPNPGKGD